MDKYELNSFPLVKQRLSFVCECASTRMCVCAGTHIFMYYFSAFLE